MAPSSNMAFGRRALGLDSLDPRPLHRVVGVHSQAVDILNAADIVIGAQGRRLPFGPLHPSERPVVGDVAVVVDDHFTTLPRRTALRRHRDGGGAAQDLACNIDEVWCVVAADQGLNHRRLERALLLAWDSGATPVVVITKVDLLDAGERQAIASECTAAASGADVVGTSAHEGVGVDALADRVRPLGESPGRTAALLGVSGAGKSGLLNGLMGKPAMREGALRVDDGRGRHTTSTRSLHVLPEGGCVIDTPGLRAFGVGVDEETLGQVFPEIELLAAGCRFADCAHGKEPGCAVRAGVSAERLSAFHALEREAAHRRGQAQGREAREARRRDRAFTNMAWEATHRKRR